MLLSQFNREDLQAIINQLDQSLYNHQQWYNALIRTLICRLPADQHDIQPDAHHQCRFGQWYYSNATKQLERHPGFLAIGTEHQNMHQLAAHLLNENINNLITSYDYDIFSNALERMRLEVYALKREFEDVLHNRDMLTGATSRVSMLPLLRDQRALIQRQPQTCCITMLDLDNFKKTNDQFGHAAGDKVLAAVVHYIIEHMRPYDRIFRYGGEEFLLCMPNTELSLAIEIVERLRAGIAELAIDIGPNGPAHITVSFGLTVLDPYSSVEESVSRADKAMYAAKSGGRNCIKVWEAALE